MKKLFFSLLAGLILLPFISNAQDSAGTIANMWSSPAVYQYNEEVTWNFDLSGMNFAQGEDVYLWIWSPSEPDAGNFNNSSDFAKLTWEHDFIWSFTLTPTLYFSRTPEEIAASAGFWFRLKDDAGTKQSEVAQFPYNAEFTSFFTSGEVMRSYPASPLIDSPISILFNANLVAGFADATSIHMHSGMNTWAVLQEYQSWLPEIAAKTALKNMGNGFWKMDLTPSEYYNNIPDGFIMENITFLFVKDDWAGTSQELVIYAGDFVPPPPPVFRFFPSQISKKDFLGIIRTNNEPGINTLQYTITAGSATIEGVISGGSAEIKGFVNLPSALLNISVTEIHVLVKDNTDRTITDTTIPLKTLD